MGERLLIAFIPQKRVVKNLIKIRKLAGIKSKHNSAPHITIVDNSYSDMKKVDKKLKEIAKSFKPFVAEIKGLDTFKVKQNLKIERYKQNNSLIYRIKNNNSMNKFRKEVIIKLNHFKTSDRLNEWIVENPKMSKRGLSNVEKYGTPFGLREWKFHTTIGLISKEKQKEILKKISKLNLEGSWTINHFGLFVRKDGWVLHKKYSLL